MPIPRSYFPEKSHKRLIIERMARGLTQDALAKELHISRSVYAQLESGKRAGAPWIWQALESYFNIEMEELKK